MSDIAAGTAAALLASTDVTDIVGNGVFPNWSRMSTNVYPLIVYNITGITPIQTFNSGTNALHSATLTVAAIGWEYADAVAVSRAVVASLDDTSGTWAGITVQGCFLNDDGINDEVVNEPESEAILYHVRECAFTVWYVDQ